MGRRKLLLVSSPWWHHCLVPVGLTVYLQKPWLSLWMGGANVDPRDKHTIIFFFYVTRCILLFIQDYNVVKSSFGPFVSFVFLMVMLYLYVYWVILVVYFSCLPGVAPRHRHLLRCSITNQGSVRFNLINTLTYLSPSRLQYFGCIVLMHHIFIYQVILRRRTRVMLLTVDSKR